MTSGISTMAKRRLRAASVEELARGGALAKRQKVTPEAASDQKRNIKRTIHKSHMVPSKNGKPCSYCKVKKWHKWNYRKGLDTLCSKYECKKKAGLIKSKPSSPAISLTQTEGNALSHRVTGSGNKMDVFATLSIAEDALVLDICKVIGHLKLPKGHPSAASSVDSTCAWCVHGRFKTNVDDADGHELMCGWVSDHTMFDNVERAALAAKYLQEVQEKLSKQKAAVRSLNALCSPHQAATRIPAVEV